MNCVIWRKYKVILIFPAIIGIVMTPGVMAPAFDYGTLYMIERRVAPTQRGLLPSIIDMNSIIQIHRSRR